MSKPQDGFVSRYLNRPISRRITQVLLRFPISPNAWTMSIFIVPALSCLFLLRGDYVGTVLGAALLQLYSVLDGCDGEIAREKNLESKFGELLDNLCDTIASILFVVALGFGLHHPAEGTACGGAIAVNELLLALNRGATSVGSSALYIRHRRMIDHSGLHRLGERPVWWIMQVTKRDVAVLFFLFLALAGLATWILHVWLAVAIAGTMLSGVAVLSSRARDRRLAAPRA